MKKNIQYISIILFALLFVISGCQKDSYELGDLVAPSNVTLNYEIVGVDAENPNGDGSGLVNFIATADNKITFNFEFGDGKKIESATDGTITHQFSDNGLNTYNVSVFAVGTGGITSVKAAQVEVLSDFEDPDALEFLTGGSSKSWYWAADQPGHAGMGTQSDDYGNLDYTFASWWNSAPWEKECMYDAEFVFTKTDNGLTFEQTEGQAFIPGTYAGVIGVDPDACYGEDIVPTLYGVKEVKFSPSSSKAAIDGDYRGTSMLLTDGGAMCWYVGQSEYDIIEVTENILRVRIKEDETNAWYHTFTNVKPVQ